MRHVQLLSISGAVGSGLFVSIGSPLTAAGPLGLLIGIIIWSTVIFGASNCLIEMTTLLPLTEASSLSPEDMWTRLLVSC